MLGGSGVWGEYLQAGECTCRVVEQAAGDAGAGGTCGRVDAFRDDFA